jgi:hypothetical protein
MGVNASSFIVDLFFSYLEYEFMIDKKNPSNIKYLLSNNKRYLDDLQEINCSEFFEILNKIYPPELKLESSNGKGNYDHFLDLDINVTPNNALVFKIYNKIDDFNFEIVNFPFPKSKRHSNITYSLYFPQLFKYAQICTKCIGFKSRSQKVIS